ncbi:hypothetical protein HDK64DRAFT_92216 [Phyllosticta capitalensis]
MLGFFPPFFEGGAAAANALGVIFAPLVLPKALIFASFLLFLHLLLVFAFPSLGQLEDNNIAASPPSVHPPMTNPPNTLSQNKTGRDRTHVPSIPPGSEHRPEGQCRRAEMPAHPGF